MKLDRRFSRVLHDKDFSRNAPVDRYGRKLARDDTSKQLKKFYRLDDEHSGGEEGEHDEEQSEVSSIDNDDEVQRELRRVEGRPRDPARQGGYSESSSSSESESSDDEDEDAQFGDVDDSAGELEFPDKQQADVPMGEVTDRIAVVNLDWENIRAEDLMAVFSSFLPTGGRVRHASVYPSEFGRERMEREEIEGPPREIFAREMEEEEEDSEDDEEEDDEEDSEQESEKLKKSILKEDKGEEFNATQLRRYQLERLRYFYGILTFSSKDAAKHVYDLVDGAEYLASANFLDLRFVPEEVDFSDVKPRDECKRVPDGYRPNDFVTDALQHSKVKLTWDADDKSRHNMQARLFSQNREDVDDDDLRAYLASDDSDEDHDGSDDGQVGVVDASTQEKDGSTVTSSMASKREQEKQRLRVLLGLGHEQAKSSASKSDAPVGEMEVTFTSGLAGEPSSKAIFENEPEVEETTIDKYVRKQRERKKRRKERIKAAKHGEPLAESGQEREEAKREPLGLVAKAEQGQQQQESEDLGFDDPFFEEPDGRATARAQRKEEKRRKREERASKEAAAASQRAELELLMMDDKKSEIKHFDMNEIEKEEKRARKKNKKASNKTAHSKGGEKQAAVDDFQMKVDDPRFARLFENHEFAIDPTNPRYKATSGMETLLEEGRKRRRDREHGKEYSAPDEGQRKKLKKGKGSDAKGDDLQQLVEKVKRKTSKGQ